jgi:uncharacterized protein
MRIFIDIGHPAHVHYFKNFIKIMKAEGHDFLITARDKEITFELLQKYGIPYVNRGKGGNGLTGKLLYMLRADWILYKTAKKFKPDLFLSFASTYAAHASALYRKPHIAIDDTEHAKLELLIYPPFTEVILTPSCFLKDLGEKQIRFNSYIEFSYLHKDFFKPDPSIRKELGVEPNEKFVLFRFISWTASHDIGQAGIPDPMKKELVELFLKNNFKVFVSSEKSLDSYFEPFRLKTDSSKIHQVIKEASFLIGESGTMSTEACILGTPAVFVNTLNAGVFMDEVKYGLLYSYRNSEGLIQKIFALINKKELKEAHHQRAMQLMNDKINITAFLVWFVKDYPKSAQIMKRDPSYQNNFK